MNKETEPKQITISSDHLICIQQAWNVNPGFGCLTTELLMTRFLTTRLGLLKMSCDLQRIRIESGALSPEFLIQQAWVILRSLQFPGKAGRTLGGMIGTPLHHPLSVVLTHD